MFQRFAVLMIALLLLAACVGCNELKKKARSDSAHANTDGVVKLVGFDGVEKAIAEAKGKVVLIDCWATWCGPCVSSFPKLVEKHVKYADRGLVVISVSLDDTADIEDVVDFLKSKKATFTNLLLTRDESAQRGLKTKLGYKGGIPHAVLFSRTGDRVWTGHPMEDDLPKMIELELAK